MHESIASGRPIATRDHHTRGREAGNRAPHTRSAAEPHKITLDQAWKPAGRQQIAI